MTGSMDHMEPSLSSAKVGGGAIPLLEAPSDHEAVFLEKGGILTEDEQVKKVFRLNLVGKVYFSFAIFVSFGQGDHGHEPIVPTETSYPPSGAMPLSCWRPWSCRRNRLSKFWSDAQPEKGLSPLKEKRRQTHFGPPKIYQLDYLDCTFPSGCVAKAIDTCTLWGRWPLAQHMTYNLVLSSGSGIVGTDFQKSDDNLMCSLKKHSCLLFASHVLSLFLFGFFSALPLVRCVETTGQRIQLFGWAWWQRSHTAGAWPTRKALWASATTSRHHGLVEFDQSSRTCFWRHIL